jgi:hypothetical protein
MEIEAYIIIPKDSNDPRKAIGYEMVGNPKFLFFSDQDVNAHIKSNPQIRQYFKSLKIMLKFEKTN